MTKTGRNDPCPCGSGRKYKLCCANSQGGAHAALSAQPGIAQTLQIALEHHQAGRLALAEPLYRRVLQTNPDHPDALYFSGMLARQSGDLDSASIFFSHCLRVNARHCLAALSLGNVQLAQGQAVAAEQSYRSAITADSGNLEAHANLGNALQSQGRLEAALESYRRALAINPDSAEILGNQGNVLQATGDFNAAIASYEKALTIKPHSAELLGNLGMSLHSRGNIDEAIASYTKSLAIKPDFAPAHYNLGISLQARGNIEGAIASYGEALRLMPGNARIHVNLASVFQAQGKPEDAVASYRQAIMLDPDLVAAHNGLTALLGALVPLWHVPMMNDKLRNDAYFQALKAAIKPESHVLEIGTGSGLLSMMAAKLGAKSVTTCEAEPLIAAMAKRVIADNGLSHRINAIARVSNDLNIGAELAAPADILVSEVLSSELLGEHVLPSIEDAKRRLLKPGGRLIPASGSIMIALFGGEAIGSNVIVEDSCGFNLRQFNAIVQRKQGITRNDLIGELLCDDIEAFHFDFQNQAFHPGESKVLRIPVKSSGRCFGIIQWIRLRMDENTVFENHPSIKAAASGWQHLAYVFPAPVDFEAGQVARVSAVHNRIFPWFTFEGIE
ncbi:MAG: tetratricopeptide repeat protein [Betaproteobacteria bacterium]|nr:tetratricopeptide repeat protein [Betaproteobacteria bacterium]